MQIKNLSSAQTFGTVIASLRTICRAPVIAVSVPANP